MNIALKIAALTLGIAAFTAAHAQTGLYVGANVAKLQYAENGFPEVNPTAIAIRIGNQFNENFAAEVRLGTGLSDDTVTFAGAPITFKVDNFVGVYAKGIIPITSWFAPYAMVGYTHGKLTGKTRGLSMSTSASDFSYGAGVDFPIAKHVSLNFEVARLFAGDGYKVNAISAGVAYKF